MSDTDGQGFSAAEKAAMKARVEETKRKPRRTAAERAAEEREAAEAAIADLTGDEHAVVAAIHDLVTATAPGLAPRTWYGMPAYARGKDVVCFIQPGSKFGSRYTTLGFNDSAALDDGAMWAASFAVVAVGDAERARIAELVRRAVGDEG